MLILMTLTYQILHLNCYWSLWRWSDLEVDYYTGLWWIFIEDYELLRFHRRNQSFCCVYYLVLMLVLMIMTFQWTSFGWTSNIQTGNGSYVLFNLQLLLAFYVPLPLKYLQNFDSLWWPLISVLICSGKEVTFCKILWCKVTGLMLSVTWLFCWHIDYAWFVCA